MAIINLRSEEKLETRHMEKHIIFSCHKVKVKLFIPVIGIFKYRNMLIIVCQSGHL